MAQKISRNIKLILEYDGTNFQGWQSQAHKRTIQDFLESVIGKMRLLGYAIKEIKIKETNIAGLSTHRRASVITNIIYNDI